MTEQLDHFARLYRSRQDPWDYQRSAYEAAKYAATLEALTRHHYGRALEAGCSIGVQSALLAPRCEQLLAVDFIERAVEQAAARLAAHPGAEARRAMLPEEWPQGSYDLIMLSELLYYLTGPEIDAMARCVARDAAFGAECVLVHFQGETDTELRPNAARDQFCAVLCGLRAIKIIDHRSPRDYNHRTLLFRD